MVIEKIKWNDISAMLEVDLTFDGDIDVQVRFSGVTGAHLLSELSIFIERALPQLLHCTETKP